VYVAAVEAHHDRPVGSRNVREVAGDAGCEHAGVGRFDAYERRWIRRVRAAVVGDARGGECADAGGDERDLGAGVPRARASSISKKIVE
jgi:hypothetical protein